MLLNVDHEHSRSETDPEHCAPGHIRRKHGKEEGVEERGEPPPDGPAALNGADRAAPILGADGFTNQDGTDSPLAAKTEALQTTDDEELLESVREAAKKRKEGEPQDSELQDAHAAETIGSQTRQPTTDGREQ